MGANCVRFGAEQAVEAPEAEEECRHDLPTAIDSIELPAIHSIEANLTKLIKAASEGHIEIIQYLVQDCDLNVNAHTEDSWSRTPLTIAATSGRINVVRYLVEKCGADVSAADGMGETPLIKATASGHIEVVRYLIKKRSCDVNTANRWGALPLVTAAYSGQINVVHYLVEKCRANVNARDGEGSTAMTTAAAAGHTEIVYYLGGQRRVNTNIANKHGATPLMKAAEYGHIGIVRYLTSRCRAEVNAADEDGCTAIMRATQNGHAEVVRYLVDECEGNVNLANKWGATPLIKAANEGRIDVVRLLVGQCGAYQHATDEDGCNAIMRAAQNGHLEIVCYLTEEAGGNVRTTIENCGATALIKAAGRGHLNVVRYIAGQCGVDVNATDEDGYTALMRTVQIGAIAVVQFLVVDCSADVNVKSKKGYTAIGIATDRGYQGIQHLLTPFVAFCGSNTCVTAATSTLSFDSATNNRPSWMIMPNEISLIEFVETGSVGGEFRAKWLDADAAVKLHFSNTPSRATFSDEARLWYQLRHPNVIKIYGACDTSPLPLQFFVCEYATNGSLLEHVTSTTNDSKKVWKFLYQAALGLEYLHKRGIVHGDVRCSNILIGSDGLAKLTNFGRSLSTRSDKPTSSTFGSMRWQAPEILAGESPSFTSDVYSLGMCIMEAVTKKIPWKDEAIPDVRFQKHYWSPEVRDDEYGEPKCPPGDARDLVWQMCSQDPTKRASLSFIVQKLEWVAIKERCGPEHEPPSDYDKANESWLDVQTKMEKITNDLHCQAFSELKKLREHLQNSSQPLIVSNRFRTLVREFYQQISMPSEQARILHLSATHSTNYSIFGFYERLQSLWLVLGESVEAARERKRRWEKQRAKYIEIFVSETSKTYLLLKELKSPEERSTFLASLKNEIACSGKYTPGQVDVLNKVYCDVANKGALDERPEWFIPWYELIVDKDNALGRGGYGSVFQAQWLDSDVVVKRLILSESDIHKSSSTWDSMLPSASGMVTSTKTRSETLKMFRREVDIWFGFSHPHVVRLFGACHVGTPFFVCEFATNGTLVEYLKKHSDKLWIKLHEAALGVQYLHARRVVHGDLKGSNIVIGCDKKAKVTDFGLSLIAGDESEWKTSAASHWVAPECFINEDACPTFASDIYSLGMCIIEALRIVDAGGDERKFYLPWGALANNIVKFHVKQGKLPSRPKACTDDQWQLVKRMCAFEPKKRIMISTVVDELARFAHGSQNIGNNITSTAIVKLESVPGVISAAHELLTRLQDLSHEDAVPGRALYSLYGSLWDRLDQIYHRIHNRLSFAGMTQFCLLVEDTEMSTNKLLDMTTSLVSLAETTFWSHTLRRRLEKFVEAHILSPGTACLDQAVCDVSICPSFIDAVESKKPNCNKDRIPC